MSKLSLLFIVCLSATSAQAQIYSECKALDVDANYVTPHKDGFAAKGKSGFVYVTKGAVSPLFGEKTVDEVIVRMTGTLDGKYLLFAGARSISVVNVASKQVLKYDLPNNIAHGRVQIVDGHAYGVAGGELFKLNLQKKQLMTKAFDANAHYWQGIWQVNGVPYIFATARNAQSKEAAYALPVDASLNLGEPVVNASYTSGMNDGTLGQVADDSGYLAASGKGQTWVVSMFENKVVNKLPRYDYDRVTAYQGLIHAQKKGGGGMDIYRFGSDSVVQTLGAGFVVAISNNGNEMIMKMADNSVKMFCK